MLPLILLLAACFSTEDSVDSADPCEGIDLPACPEVCPDDYAATCGEPCEVEGEACGNEIGDGRVCTDGVYGCIVHAPLGTGCNLVCDPDL